MKEDCVTVQTRLSVPRRVKFISSYRLSWKTSCLNSNLYFISTLIMYIIMCCKTNNSPLCNIIITQRTTHPKMCPSKYHHYGQHLNTAQFRSTKCIQRWLAFKFSAVTKHSLLDKSINIPCVSYLFFFFENSGLELQYTCHSFYLLISCTSTILLIEEIPLLTTRGSLSITSCMHTIVWEPLHRG